MYFSLYDLLLWKANSRGDGNDGLFTYFRKAGIKKAQVVAMQQLSYLPTNEKDRAAVLSYLDMSELEVYLAMGHIPTEYRQSFFVNIKQISQLLSPEVKEPRKQLEPFFNTELGTLYNGDCLDLLNSIEDEYVDMIFADPPFNLGKMYDPGINDSLTVSQYLNWTYKWLDECSRILKPGGRIFIYNLPKWCVYIASHLGETLNFQNWIAVDMKFSLPIPGRLYPAHYALVSFVKGDKPNTFNNQRIPMQVCRHCGGEIKDYGGYKGKMNPEGVNVSDVWTDIYPVRHRSDKNRKYNELSVKLLDRIVSMSTQEGDLVFDPFGGSGTTYAVAELLKRKWIGCELGDCEIIKQRILSPTQDNIQLQRVYKEKNTLFTPEVEALRLRNGFWTCSTLSEKKTETINSQISIDDFN